MPRGYLEIGNEELVGDEVDAMLGEAYPPNRFAMGAVAPQYGRQQSGYGQALAMRRMMAQTLLKEKQWTKSRQYVIGFDSSTTIAAAASSTITVQPQCIFRPERLVVDGGIASSFVITDIRVGKNSQLVATGNIPDSAFAPSSFGVRLKCDTAQVSSQISLGVTNLSGAALRFLAALFGEAVE